LCGSDVDKGKASIGRFNFTKEGLELGNKALSYERVFGKDIVVVDEVGPLELAGNGWANGINELILKYNKILILVVRDEIIENVKNYFDIENPQIINIENNSIEAAAARIINTGSKLETNLAVNI
jgi:iron complex transport system ATP-binding protein